MPISQANLRNRRNSHVTCRADQTVAEALHAVLGTCGKDRPWWYIVVAYPDGTYDALTFGALWERFTKTLDRAGFLAMPFQKLHLPEAHVIEQSSMDDDQAEALAYRLRPPMLVVVNNGIKAGILTEGRSAEFIFVDLSLLFLAEREAEQRGLNLGFITPFTYGSLGFGAEAAAR